MLFIFSTLTSTRVIGIYFFLVFLFFLILELLDNKKNATNFFLFLKYFFYFLFLYLTWPYLWSNPINNFILSIVDMANYPGVD